MKKLFIITSLIFTILLMACGEANVAGKHFENFMYPLEIDFNENTEKVFYLTKVCNYRVEKNFVIINYNDKDIKLIYKDNSLALYDEKTKKSDDFSFELKGKSTAFTNRLLGQSFEKSGVKINFKENSAECGSNTIAYSFNPETCEYTVENYAPTVYINAVKNNCYDAFVKKAFGKSESSLDYEKAWWLYQKKDNTKITEELIRIYAASYYTEEYNSVKDDEFAMNKFLNQIKPELISKFSSLNKNEKFVIYYPAKIGKYDFSKHGFALNTSLNIADLESTIAGDKTEIEPRLCAITNNNTWLGSRRDVKWLSDINTDLYLKIDEEAAEKLNNELNENRETIIAYTVKPVTEDDPSTITMADLSSGKYIMYYEVVSANLLNVNSMQIIGDVKLMIRW